MSPRSNRLLAWGGIVVSVLYLLNPGFGIIAEIPDNFPVIGNLDEVGATLLLVQCVQALRSKKPLSKALPPRS